MNRWLQLAAVVSVLLCAALATQVFTWPAHGQGELLVYDLAPSHGVRLPFPADARAVLVTSWLVSNGPLVAGETTGYSLEIDLLVEGQERKHFASTFEARADYPDGLVPSVPGDPAQVLAPHTTRVVVGELARGGELRIAASAQSRVLLRATVDQPRERADLARRERLLQASDLVQLSKNSGSLTYFDLPLAYRSMALADLAPSLSAAGTQTRDYRTARLTTTSIPTASRVQADTTEPPRPAAAVWKAWSFLALDEFCIHGPAGARVEVALGDQLTRHTLPDTGELTLAPDLTEPASVLVRAIDPVPLRLSVRPEAQAALVTKSRPSLVDGRLFVDPDVTRLPAYRLTEDHALEFAVHDQQPLALSLRTIAQGAGPQAGHVVVSFEGIAAALAQGEETFETPPSEFVSHRGAPATLARSGQLNLPPGTRRVSLRGSSGTVVVVTTRDIPAAAAPRPTAYDAAERRSGRHFTAGPDVQPSWTAIHPSNREPLDPRLAWLTAPVRLQPVTTTESPVETLSLKPLFYNQQRALFEPATYSPTNPWPKGAWTLLDKDQPTVRVTSPRSERVEYWYRSGADGLNLPFDLLLDGRLAAQESQALTTGKGWLTIPAGQTELGFAGLGTHGAVLVKAKRSSEGPIVQRGRAYASARGTPLRFRFQHLADSSERITLVVTGGPGAGRVGVRYTLDGGAPERGAVLLSHGTSNVEGEASLVLGTRGPAWLWSTEGAVEGAPLDDQQADLTLNMTDDLAPGEHELEVELVWAQPASATARASSLNRYLTALLSRRPLGPAGPPQEALNP